MMQAQIIFSDALQALVVTKDWGIQKHKTFPKVFGGYEMEYSMARKCLQDFL